MEKENELIKIAENMKNADFKYLKESMEPLKEILPKPAVIKERDFKIYFLPIIDGSIELNVENVERFKHNMVELTESFKLGFSVYTDDLEELLFKLPPLLMDVDKDGLINQVNFSKLGNMYKEMSTGSNTTGANNFLESSFNGLSKILVPDENEVNFYDNEIKKIFSRYNIKSSEERKSNDSVEVSTSKETKKIDSDAYDDLFDYE